MAGTSMTRYAPARHYAPAAIVAFSLAVFAGWCGWSWKPAFIPAALFVLSSALLVFLATRPVIVIRDSSWSVGNESFLWSEVERVDTTGWSSPLVLRIALRGGRLMYVIYPGEANASGRLLRQMRRLARGAWIEGIPHKQYWGEHPLALPEEHDSSRPRYRMLRPEDEDEVERLYNRLKAAGHIDHQTSSEERRD
jgi:hypothetical protein